MRYKMQLSTAIPKLGAVSYAELRLAMRAALVEQRVWNVVRNCPKRQGARANAAVAF